MGSESIMSVKQSVTISTMIKIDGDGACKRAFNINVWVNICVQHCTNRDINANMKNEFEPILKT